VHPQQNLPEIPRLRRSGAWFPRKTAPQRFDDFSSTITDNFRVIDPNDFRILA
jgi:hypothetical protein